MGTNTTVLDNLDETTRAAVMAALADMQASGQPVLTDADEDVPMVLAEPEPQADPEPEPETPAPAAEEKPKPTLAEKLTLTKTQRESLVKLFMEGDAVKVRRIKGLLQYHRWTVSQVIAAMHESADRDGVALVVDAKAESTMKRSMAIVKAWVATEANVLVTAEDEYRDDVFLYLSQIADITNAALENYLVPEEERETKALEWYPVVVEPLKNAEEFEPFEVDLDHGAGNGSIPGLVAEYVTHRLKDESGFIAADWLRRYRDAVKFASNERRRENQAHDTLAADARVGKGDGSSKKPGARFQGGTTGAKESHQEGAPDHRMPGEKPVRDLTVREIAVALHKRVVDYSQPLTVEDLQAMNDLAKALDTRMEHVPVGKTVVAPAPVKAPDAKPAPAVLSVVEQQEARQAALQVAPAGPNKDALVRAILATLTAQGLTPQALQAVSHPALVAVA